MSSPALPTTPSRLRAIATAPLGWLRLLLVPDRAVPEAVGEGRYLGPLVIATLAALLAALTIAAHLDFRATVGGGPGGGGPGGGGPGGGAPPAASAGRGESGMSERERAEAIEKARSVETVTRGLRAAALPVELCALALALYAVARYVGGRPTPRRAFALASVAALPGAVRSLLEALAASRRPLLPPAELPSLVLPPLHPASPALARLVDGVDPFLLWSVALLAIGMPRMAAIGWRRSLATVTVCFALWLVVSRLVFASPPGGAGVHS